MSQHSPAPSTHNLNMNTEYSNESSTNPSTDNNAYSSLPGTPGLPDGGQATPLLVPPDAPFLSTGHSISSTPRGSAAYPDSSSGYIAQQPGSDSRANLDTGGENETPLIAGNKEFDSFGSELNARGIGLAGVDAKRRKPLWKRPLFWLVAAAAVVAVVLAVILPVYFLVIRPNNRSASDASNSGGSGGGGNGGGGHNGGGGGQSFVTSGGDGSTVTKADGSTFTYRNPFGGFWVADPENPFLDNAQPNSWTPPLNQSWKWGQDRIYGVNLGGLFVLEPFISPALYQPFNGSADDEWSLSTLLAAEGQLQEVLEKHYDTFITEEDLAEIAGAGLNWVRLPVPFWAIDTWSDVGQDPETGNTVAEPFLAQVCWKYILRVLGWARKYGLRVNLDLHAVPGSQNGYNHSGRLGRPNFLNGPMGIANAQRTLDYIRTFTEFISQSEYADVVQMFSIVNEALVQTIGRDTITAFYLHAHDMIRSITGVGEGHGPFIAVHDGFMGVGSWRGFLEGSDRIALDTHPYFAFDGQPNNEPIDVPAEGSDGSILGGQWPRQACSAWGNSVNGSRSNFGVTIAGEFSNGFNDCGLFLNGVANGPRSAADCDLFMDSSRWDQNTKDGLKAFAMASMDALGDWFFWTWKIGNSTAGRVETPLWSYQLGLQNGWMPTDPREALGMCARVGVTGTPFDGTFESWQTGGAGAGTIAATAIAANPWPPTSIANVPAASVSLLPTYIATGSIQTLPPPTFSPTPAPSVNVGNGWTNPDDTQSFVTPISGCAYLDAWSAVSQPIPSTVCTGAVATAR